jgi:signal transduction histidine kinase
MSLRLRLGIEWLIIGIIASLLVFFANRWDGTLSLDNLFYDQLSSVSRPAADPNTLLINIDDYSLAQVGKWPWPRDVHAQMIDKLQTLGPRSITLDVILSETSDPLADAALAKAMEGPSPVIMPMHFVAPGSDGRNYDIIPPAKPFADAANGIGQVNVAFDSDGVVRRVELCFDPESSGSRWPHMMEKVFRVGKVKPSDAYTSVECEASLLIPYAKRGGHSEISYSEMLNGTVPPDLVAGRDIIIGGTATGMGDSYPVPYGDGGVLAGSEIMANILRAIKQDSFITPVPKYLTAALSLIPLWILLIGFLRWSPRVALIGSITVVTAILAGTVIAFGWQYWFPPTAALLGILIVYPLWGWRRLQAMSDFMAQELDELEAEGETLPVPVRQASAGDLVGRQSTALARAIDHMKDLRRFVADALSDLPDPMLVVDLSGRVLLENDLAKERLRQSIIGLSFVKVMNNVTVPEQRDNVADFIDSSDQTPRDRSSISNPNKLNSIRFDTVEGDTYVMRKSALENSTSELLGYIFYFADITNLATAEAERERVLQLLSHDMRAPQSAIISSLEGPLDQKARQRIERNARRTIQLAQDFVDMARMGESEFKGEDILLADLVRDVADNYWPLARERGIKIEIEDQSEAGFVSAEADSLSRAFANLTDNAIKFSPADKNINIDVDRIAHNDKPYLRVRISDNGEGISPEILPNLFKRFVTGGKQHGRIKGSGLGLTYILAVVERHGGEVSGKNRAEGGACFTVLLPEAIDDAAYDEQD